MARQPHVGVPRSPRTSAGSALDDLVALGVPGALARVDDGARTWHLARGLADREGRRRLLATDRFRIGSITKTFVATVVLQLVAAGSLELDAPVERWLPGVVPRSVTVRKLLDHTSGLFDYVNDSRAFERHVADPLRLVSIATSHPPLGLAEWAVRDG